MKILALSAVSLLATSTLAFSQAAAPFRRAPGPAKNAGVFHLATGTWTRSVDSSASLGPSIIYNNSANSGYFADLGFGLANDTFSFIDEGRVPTSNSVVIGDAPIVLDTYVVDALEFSYCTDADPGAVGVDFRIYDTYSPCDSVYTAPQFPQHLAGLFALPALPGSPSGASTCWIVTIDATGGEFCLLGDGGALSQGTQSFGIEWRFDEGVLGTTTGPMISGDPGWTRSLPGATVGGGGTFYAAETCSAGSTGLDTMDFFQIDGIPAPPFKGCRFFGGYLNTNGCAGIQRRPLASFHTILFADLGATDCNSVLVEPFCEPAGSNSSGLAVDLAAQPSSVGTGYRLEAAGGPTSGTSFGFFVMSESTAAALPIGQGTLCLGTPQGRYNPANGPVGNSLGQFDTSGVFVNLSGTSTTGLGFDLPSKLPVGIGGSIAASTVYHFQLWYRDLNPAPTVNFSNGLSIQF